MIELSAKYDPESKTFENWKFANEVILKNMDQEMQDQWKLGGYEKIAPVAEQKFGMVRMYRGTDFSMRFVFTDEQWSLFLLRYA